MKKSLIAIALATTFLGGCGASDVNETAATEVTKTTATKAELGSFGVDLSARNEAVKPGDDFSVLVHEELGKVPTYVRLPFRVWLCFFEPFIKLAGIRSIDLDLRE